MNPKIVSLMWSISLIAIGIATILLAGTSIAAVELPDILVRILGAVDLIALPVLAFSTVKKVKRQK